MTKILTVIFFFSAAVAFLCLSGVFTGVNSDMIKVSSVIASISSALLGIINLVR